jgi:hypothetical protein
MTTHRVLNVALALAVIAAWMFIASRFDAELMDGDARHFAQFSQESRLERAARNICGENGAARMTSETEFVCITKRGYKTRIKGVL